jgi:hypothetical protein
VRRPAAPRTPAPRGRAGVVVAREWLWTSADRPPGHHMSRDRTRARAPGSPPVGHLRGARGARTPPSNRPSPTMRHGAAPEGGPPAAVGSGPTADPERGMPRRAGSTSWATCRRARNATSDAAVPAAKGVTRSADEARAFRSPSGVVDGDPASFLARRSDGADPARARWRPGRTPEAADDCGPPCPWHWQYEQPHRAAQPAARHHFVTVRATAALPDTRTDPVPGATSLSG